MITGIASLTFVPLLAIAMVHIMWAFGSTWPALDEKTLARTVAGFRDIENMPPRFMSAFVAIGVLTAGVWVLAMADPQESLLMTIGGAVFTAIFLGRGIISFTPQWREKTPEEPFRTMDRKFYSPLCIGIGLGFLVLTVWRIM